MPAGPDLGARAFRTSTLPCRTRRSVSPVSIPSLACLPQPLRENLGQGPRVLRFRPFQTGLGAVKVGRKRPRGSGFGSCSPPRSMMNISPARQLWPVATGSTDKLMPDSIVRSLSLYTLRDDSGDRSSRAKQNLCKESIQMYLSQLLCTVDDEAICYIPTTCLGELGG